jgi:hypothetical protein
MTEGSRQADLDALAGLDVAQRAARIAGLQAGRTSSRDERAIRDLFLATTGETLTALKNALDGGRGHRDLHQLIFHDIDDAAIRAEILAHFGVQAKAAPQREVKILSDIDDTFYANWKDRRFPKKTVYPGVLQLFKELDRGPGEVAGRPGDLTFVSARPGDRLGLVERRTLESLAARGIGAATMLAGSFSRLIGNASIASKKFDNFVELLAIYPEYGFVFVGDSGQGDVFFGERLLGEHPSSIRLVLIHDVVATPDERRAEHARRGVIFFDTYVGAAIVACNAGLIQREGLERVARAAEADLEAVIFEDDATRAARRAELARDLERVAT